MLRTNIPGQAGWSGSSCCGFCCLTDPDSLFVLALVNTVLLSACQIKLYLYYNKTFMFDVVPSPGSGRQAIHVWLSLASMLSFFFILLFSYLVSQVSGSKEESKVSALSVS